LQEIAVLSWLDARSDYKVIVSAYKLCKGVAGAHVFARLQKFPAESLLKFVPSLTNPT
jgi:hypothetical protein